MATSVINTCDLVLAVAEALQAAARGECPHGAPSMTKFEGTVEGRRYEGDLCYSCVPELEKALGALGIRPSIALVGGKPRNAYTAKSGSSFSSAEARVWLAENGYEVPTAGRLSDELLDAYAEAH